MCTRRLINSFEFLAKKFITLNKINITKTPSGLILDDMKKLSLWQN